MAAALGHDAQTAKTEYLQIHRPSGRQLPHLGQGKHSRQHGTANVDPALVKG